VVIYGLKKDRYLMKELSFIFEKSKYANVKFYDKFNIDEFYRDKFNFAILIDVEVELKEKEKEKNEMRLF
jgi:hypothetical protein